MVTVVVPLSRCMYAQLVQQPFEPPRGRVLPPPDSPAFKPAQLGLKLTAGLEMMYWRAARGDPNPTPDPDPDTRGRMGAAPASRAARGTGTPDLKSDPDTADCSGVGDGISAAAPAVDKNRASTSECLEESPGFQRFLASLERSGYFGGAAAGSARRQELLGLAAAGFAAQAAAARAAAALADPARRVDQLLTAPLEPERLEQVGKNPCCQNSF